MNRNLALAYGTFCYLTFLGVFLYSIGFVGNLFVPKTVDSGVAGPVGTAIVIDLLLLTLFALQHSVMARPTFKRGWTRFVPEPVERATYVLLTCVALGLLFWGWQPIEGVVWSASGVFGGALTALYFAGWGLVLYATTLIDHFDLFGMQQVVRYWRDRDTAAPHFVTPSLYKYIRHPLYVGWFTVFWATPTMSYGHLLLAVVTTAYILVAVRIEERDLEDVFGKTYQDYRESTPAFVPTAKRSRSGLVQAQQ